MKTLIIDELCIGVTRKCNNRCLHCMRGDAQNVDLSLEDIDTLFHNEDFEIRGINSLVITGGEPTMNSSAIIKIINEIIEQEIALKSFTMVINGRIYKQELADSLNTLYHYSKSCSDNGDFDLICSLDQFHKKPSENNLEAYQKLPFFWGMFRNLPNEDILRIGRAAENNLGSLEMNSFFYYMYSHYRNNNNPTMDVQDDGSIVLNQLYLSAKGKYGFHYMDSTYDMIDALCIYDYEQLKNLIIENAKVRRIF